MDFFFTKSLGTSSEKCINNYFGNLSGYFFGKYFDNYFGSLLIQKCLNNLRIFSRSFLRFFKKVVSASLLLYYFNSFDIFRHFKAVLQFWHFCGNVFSNYFKIPTLICSDFFSLISLGFSMSILHWMPSVTLLSSIECININMKNTEKISNIWLNLFETPEAFLCDFFFFLQFFWEIIGQFLRNFVFSNALKDVCGNLFGNSFGTCFKNFLMNYYIKQFLGNTFGNFSDYCPGNSFDVEN